MVMNGIKYGVGYNNGKKSKHLSSCQFKTLRGLFVAP